MRKILLALAFAILTAAPALAAPCGPIPALPDVERRTEYTGIVAQTGPFNVSFQLYGDSTDYGNWLEVWVNGVKKTAVTDYTVTSPSGALGSLCLPISNAQVTFTAAQSGTIEIVGARRPRRTSQFSENRGVTAHDLNQLNSDIIAMEREQWDLKTRLIQAPPGETLSVLPSAASRASKFLTFNGSGDVSLASPTPGLGNVIGPATSTNGGLAVWASTSGTLLADGAGSDVYFGSGRPWCDPRSKGAKGDGSTDDTAAFNACLTTLAALGGGGGTLYIPPGTYCLFSGISISLPVYIKGSVVSYLSACAHDVTVVTLANSNSIVDGVVVLGNNSVTATGDGIHITSACVRCTIQNTIVEFGRYGILIDGADHVLYNVQVAATYGTAMVRTNAGGFHYRTKLDTSWPAAQPTSGALAAPGARLNAHAYSTNDVVTQGGFYLQATSNGTTAGSFPGLQPYGTPITDGTVTWKIVVPTTYYLLQVDGGTTTLLADGGDYSGPATAGVAMVNTNAGAGPEALVISNGTFGGAITQEVLLNAGNDFKLIGSQIASCAVTTCSGVNMAGSWSGDVLVQGNTFFSLPTAINYGVGNGLRVIGNGIFGGVASAVGISVAANLNNFTIKDTNFSSPIWTAVTTGVSIAAGTSNHYRIGGLICTGTSTCVSDGGTGTDKQVENQGTMTGSYTWSTATNSVIFGGGSGSYDLIHGGTNSFDLFQNATFAGNGVQFGQLSTGHAFLTNIDNQPIDFSTNNTARWHVGATGGFYSDAGSDGGNGTINLGSAGSYQINADTFLTRSGAAAWQLGAADAAAPVAQTLRAQSVVGGTNNTAGTDLSITGSRGTGSATGGAILLRTAAAGGAGSSQNSSSTRIAILGSGNIGFGTETNPAVSQWVFGANTTTGITTSGLTVNGVSVVGADSATAGFNVFTFANNGLNFFARANGTAASPTAVASGDNLGQLAFAGYYVTGGPSWTGAKARIFGLATDNWTSALQGTALEFDTTAAGGTTRAQAMLIKAGVIIGTGTTDPGANNLIAGGTIEATGVFRNNGNAGLTATKTVRASGGAADCTLIYTGGILTGGSC